MLSKLFPLVLLPGFALCGLLVNFSEAHLEEARVSFSGDEIEAAKKSIALSLMGQVQFTAQSLVWMKTLEYLHNGVVFRMPTNAEEEHGFRAQNSVGTVSGLEHAEGVDVALNDELDWRGPVGKLHRTILPHMTKHSHSDPVELIPWYELALKLNPNIERLYSMGAFFMADFAKQPKRALDLLRAGVRANPWTYEVRGSLGRLLFEYHLQLGIEPQQAYEEAATVLREAVNLAKKEKVRLESNKEHFDDYQKQVFRESYLFLARSLTELGRYEEAVNVCEEGYKITENNHLNVQKRITTRRMNGEVIETPKSELSASGKVNPTTATDNADGQKAHDSQSTALEKKQPISVTLGIAPPEQFSSFEERPIHRIFLTDVHDHPYESFSRRVDRLNVEYDALAQVSQELCELQFIAVEDTGATPPSDEKQHCLTPIGLYIYLGKYGFDFWRQMEQEAETLREQGMPVDLFADAQRVWEEMQ